MNTRYVPTIVTTYSVLSWISAVVLFILALALTFLSPFAITFFLEQNPAAVPAGFSLVAFQQLTMGVAVMSGVIVFMLAAFFLAIGVGLWRRNAWARHLVLVACVPWLFSFPVGTLVGAFGIYAFAFDKDVREAFGVAASPAKAVVATGTKRKR